MVVELNEHKRLACKQHPTTLHQNNSVLHINLDPIKVEPNRGEQQISTELSVKVENQCDKQAQMATLSNKSNAQLNSFGGQKRKRHKKRLGPFECKECEKVYTKRFDWTQHQMTHTGVRPFECWMCHRK